VPGPARGASAQQRQSASEDWDGDRLGIGAMVGMTGTDVGAWHNCAGPPANETIGRFAAHFLHISPPFLCVCHGMNLFAAQAPLYDSTPEHTRPDGMGRVGDHALE